MESKKIMFAIFPFMLPEQVHCDLILFLIILNIFSFLFLYIYFLISISSCIRCLHTNSLSEQVYLRELQTPLLTYDLYDQWIAAYRIADHAERLRALQRLVYQLPKGNQDTLTFLCRFLAVVCKVLMCLYEERIEKERVMNKKNVLSKCEVLHDIIACRLFPFFSELALAFIFPTHIAL